MYLISLIGQICLYLAFFMAWLLFFLVWKKDKLISIITILYYCIPALMAMVFLLLVDVFIRKDYAFLVVYNYVSNSMSLSERISASWVSRPGVMILWGLYMATFSSFAWFKLKHLIKNPIVRRSIILTSLFSAIIVSFAISPHPGAFAVQTATTNGLGLSPSLLSVWNLIHPLFAFLSYSSFIFPFAAGLAIISLKSENNQIPKELNRLIDFFMILGWVMTSILIIAGSLWGYEENWSGFWAWDPVEIAALVIWGASSLYFHGKTHADADHLFHAFLATLGWLAVAFASFIVRSGLLGGLHSYAGSVQMYIFGAMLLLSIGAVVYVMMNAKTQIFPVQLSQFKTFPNKIAKLTFWMLTANVIVNVVGLLIQLVYSVEYKTTAIPYIYYIPLNAVTLIGAVVLLPFCDMKLDRLLVKNRRSIAIAGLAVLVSFIYFLISKLPSIFQFAVSVVIGAALLIQILDISLSVKHKRKYRKIGQQISHLAVILMVLAYFSTSYAGDIVKINAEPNTLITVPQYEIQINVTRLFVAHLPQVEVTLYDMSGNFMDTLILKEGIYNGDSWNSGDWYITPFYDLFIHLSDTSLSFFETGATENVNLEIHRIANVNIFRFTFIFLLFVAGSVIYSSLTKIPTEYIKNE